MMNHSPGRTLEDSASHTDTWSILDAESDELTSQSGDSALGDDAADSTMSLRSSLFEGVTENGRMYHRYKEGKYVLPSDDAELDRLDLQHQLFLMTTKYKLYLAPLKPDAKWVLDAGTGTGIWAIDFAQEHPDCEVLGVDLVPSQPNFVPLNCRFEIDDLEEPWTWTQKFDLIHARAMTTSFANEPKFFQQCFDNLESGGWLEMQDFDFPLSCQDETMHEETAIYKWGKQLEEGIAKMGRHFGARKYRDMMKEIGFVDIHEVIYAWPQNPWPKNEQMKELGGWNLMNSLDGVEGYTMAVMTRAQGMSKEAVQLMLVDVRKDMKNKAIHAYWPIYYVYGRKP